jgi:hypothetical protein
MKCIFAGDGLFKKSKTGENDQPETLWLNVDGTAGLSTLDL